MRVCFIVGAFPNIKCGVGDYTYNIALAMSKENDISVITSKHAIKNDDFNVYNIIEKWNFRSLKTILRKLKEINPNIVHIQYPSDEYKKNIMINFLPFVIRKFLKTKVIITIHEYSCASKLGKIRNFISAKFANETIVVENRYINDMKKDFVFLANHVNFNYVPIFSNIPKYNMGEEELLELRKSLALDNCKVISFFGFVNKLKGFENILVVLKKFIDNSENVKLLFVGAFKKSDEYHNEILKKIEEYGLKNNIIVTGFIEAPSMVANYLKISDVCMLPFSEGVSERNGSFLSVYIQEIPIVTTTLENRKEENMVYYENPNDIQSFFEDLKIIFENNMRDISRKEKNSIEDITKKYLDIYNK